MQPSPPHSAPGALPRERIQRKNLQLSVVDRPEPEPDRGQVLVKVLRCGICGSDLHVRTYCDQWGAIMARSGYHGLLRSDQEVVFGHEFSAEVLDHGPGSLVVEESMMMPIPNGLDPALAALTEPMAVAWRALRRGGVTRRDTAVVIGCGPVGLSIIGLLKARGVKRVVASDLSPARRRLATACGADVVVDPAQASPYASWGDAGFLRNVPELLELVLGTSEKLRKLPLPWWHVWRLIERLIGDPRGPVVFECVGAPGVLQGIIEGVPQFARIVVVGVCMQSDRIEGAVAINKSCDLRFAAGYSPLEFHDTLHLIAEGKVNCAPMITGEVGLGGVDAAFTALGDPERHAKILIDPTSNVTAPP